MRKLNPVEWYFFLLSLFIAACSIATAFNSTNNRILLNRMQISIDDRWSGQEHRDFVEKLRKLNPDLKLPEGE